MRSQVVGHLSDGTAIRRWVPLTTTEIVHAAVTESLEQNRDEGRSELADQITENVLRALGFRRLSPEEPR